MRIQLQTSDARLAPVRPELVAAKLAAIRNYEFPSLLKQIADRPRLVELLWFLQAMSMRPGGLLKFTEELLADISERLGTQAMRAAKQQDLTISKRLEIWKEFPDNRKPGDITNLVELCADLTPRELETLNSGSAPKLRTALKALSLESFKTVCRQAALETLPRIFAEMCIEKSRGFDPQTSYTGFMAGSHSETWFVDDLIGAVLQFMDGRSAKVQKRLAMTEVAVIVFDTLDFALSEKVMVRIEGGSRFGKTEAMETWCQMRPVARLVRVPCSNSMNDFFKRIGEALGIDCSYGSNPSRLKERVEYVIQHSGLFLVLDEGAFLIPQNYSANTPPHRLNWVRTEIVDRDLPLAIAVTPQDFKSAVERFVKKTSYTMEQYFGRNFLTRTLPLSLGEKDMIAVARIHFPELDDDSLGYIAAEARLSQNYLQAVDAVARRARFLAARRRGRIALRTSRRTVAEVLPRRQIVPNPQPVIAFEDDFKAPLTTVLRGTKPVSAGARSESFQNRSLGQDRPELESEVLLSADS